MKTLKDIVTEVQEVTGLSKSELSRRIGKSRNYLVSVVKAGLTYDNEKALIQKLHAVAKQEYDEFEKLRQNLEIAEEKIIERNEDFRKLSKKYKDSEHKVVMLQKQIDQIDFQLQSYKSMSEAQQEVISTLKQDKEELSELVDIGSNQIDRQNKTIESLKEVCSELGQDSQALEIKNRFLTGAILFVFVVSAVYLGAKAYGY